MLRGVSLRKQVSFNTFTLFQAVHLGIRYAW